jgi:ABC-2 type transport system ATP-binding protein
MSELAITTDALTKTYGETRAVDGVSLNVRRGAIYGFLGRNGAGKTTTIRMLLGLAKPTAGSARVLGFNAGWGSGSDQIAILERTAFVSQKKTLYASWTPADLVRYTRGYYRSWSDSAVEKYANALEIPMKKRFGKLSQGNQTKVCLLLALAQGADLLVLDEPTVGLDPVVIDQVLRILVEDIAAEGRTIFFSSHQLSEVEQISDWVGVIDNGRLLLESRLEDIKSEYRLITAAGNALPRGRSPEVLSLVAEGNFCKYVVTKNAEAFARELSRNGATVTGVSPLSLREIFLELVRKEQPCTSGNAGATTVSVSSSF